MKFAKFNKRYIEQFQCYLDEKSRRKYNVEAFMLEQQVRAKKKEELRLEQEEKRASE